MLSIQTTLERNLGSDRLTIPYYAQVECHEIINRGPQFKIPVRAAYIGMKKTLSVEVAGFRAMTEQLSAVPRLVERLIEGIVRAGRIPHYVFIARDSGAVYPVYTVGDEVLAPTPDGPLFQHLELAKVRTRISDYLHDIGILGKNGREDKLHVRGVHRTSMQLVRPSFYLKKRVSGEDEFWAPVFRSVDSPRIYAYAANARRDTQINDGLEVMALHAFVANVLIADNRLSSVYDLRPDRLFPKLWTQLSAHWERENEMLIVNGLRTPVYKTPQGTSVGLERRPNEERFTLYLGADRDDLNERMLRDYARRGIGL
ncbi:MAG: hypothetical protein ACPG8W_01450 [Candidatus Promineifilaceae bacterium]